MPNHSDATTPVEELKQLMRDFVAERAWQPYHNPRNIACGVSIEAAELLEHFQWLTPEEAAHKAQHDPAFRHAVGEELADVLMYLMSLANALDLDVATTVHAKMVRNKAKYPADEYRGRSARVIVGPKGPMQHGGTMRIVLAMLVVLLPLVARAEVRTYRSAHFVIQSDVDYATACAVQLRLERLYDYFAVILKDLGAPREPTPVYLCSETADYIRLSGTAATHAVCRVVDGRPSLIVHCQGLETWSSLQHEFTHGFFAGTVGGLPVWMNEGVAMYFGKARFTGDGYESGMLTREDVRRVRSLVTGGQLVQFSALMAVGQAEWNDLAARQPMRSIARYDQAWSMVYFLVHADQGRYFAPFMKLVKSPRDQPPAQAWSAAMDMDLPAFERAWQTFWMALPEPDDRVTLRPANVRTLLVVAAHARAAGIRFGALQDLAGLVERQQLHLPNTPALWLPDDVVAAAFQEHDPAVAWSLTWPDGLPVLVCVPPRGPPVRAWMEKTEQGLVSHVQVVEPR